MQKIASLEKELAVRKERESIFSDIHDNLGARLLHLSVLLRSLKPKKAVTGAIKDTITNTINEIMKSLRSRILTFEDISLAEIKFEEGVRTFLLRRYGVADRKFQLEILPELPREILPKEHYHNFFSILQELVSNDLKYGKNTTKWTISGKENFIRIEMQSDSVYRQKKRKEGQGSKNIRKRTELIGGRFSEKLERSIYKAEFSYSSAGGALSAA